MVAIGCMERLISGNTDATDISYKVRKFVSVILISKVATIFK